MSKADKIAGNIAVTFGGVIVLGVIGAILFGLFSFFSGCAAVFHADTPEEKQTKRDSDFAAHPAYQSDMNALTLHLAGNGIAATWPGGPDLQPDTIYVSLSAEDRNSAAPDLAQRVYQVMVGIRQKDGYGDKSGACFVHVMDSTGTSLIASDRMGSLDH